MVQEVEKEQKNEAPQEKLTVIYVLCRCPKCGMLFLDYLYPNLDSENYVECPLCNRHIQIGQLDDGEEFQ